MTANRSTAYRIEMQPVSGQRYREMLSHLPTGVTVVSAYTSRGPAGMAANSFASVSLDPPLVLFCPAHSSETWPALREAGSFCVSVLAGDQEHLCRRFATKGIDRFAEVPFHDRPGGPALDGAVGWLDCELYAEYDAGDHVIAVARVLDLEAVPSLPALVFHRGLYRTV